MSKYESSPVSVWEALSMGKTILSYDVGDVSKFIKNDLNGFIVKRSIDNIIFNIKKIYKDKNILFKYNQNSRLIAKNQLDIKLSVKKLNNLYESLINV